MTAIHDQLLADCRLIGRFRLCHLLLLLDANYPWFILVPDRDGITEIHQLPDADQQQLIHESSRFARVLEVVFEPDKLNIAALGNLVPQLHIHHIARYRNDPAWPAPVWGRVAPRPYSPEALAGVLAKLDAKLELLPDFQPVDRISK